MRTFKMLVLGWITGALIVVALSAATRVDRPSIVAAANAAPSMVAPSAPLAARGPGLLLIPVAGIARESILDTFDQSRGGNTRRHGALDIMAPRGTPVIAAVDGTIRKLFISQGGGLTIYQFDAAEERVYYYAHLDRYADGVVEGMRVASGTVIGYVGSTGNARPDAPHLHFAIEVLSPTKEWWRGTPINPYPLLMR